MVEFNDNQYWDYPHMHHLHPVNRPMPSISTIGDDSEYDAFVLSSMGEGPKGDKGDPTYFDDLTPEQLDKIYQEASFVGNKSEDAVITTTAIVTELTIPLEMDEFDMLFIDINGLDLAEHEDYELALSSGKVIFSVPIPAGQDVHFRALKYQLVDGNKTIKNVMGRKDYNTVAEMKADMDLEAGDICHTLGFYTPGDGGAAWYVVHAHGVANGMDILQLDNDMVAVLQVTGDFVTPEMFGAYGDGVHDDVVSFYAMFDYLISHGIVIARLMAKTYFISKSLAIPENCSFIGSGIESFIYLTTGTNLGVALTNGGSNITIKDLRVGNINDNQAIGSSGYGGIGISVYDYNSVKDESLSVKADCENIIIENIYSNGSYPLQIEGGSGYTIKNVNIRNVFAPNGLISSTATSGAVHDNIHFENIVCDLFRIDYNAGESNDIFVNELSCNYLRLNNGNSNNVIVRNAKIKTDSSSLYKQSSNGNSAVFLNGNYSIENIEIVNNDLVSYGIYIYDGNSIFYNVKIKNGFETKNVESRISIEQVFYSCDLGEVESTIFGKGYSTKSTLVGGLSGLSSYFDDSNTYETIPSSTLSNASSDYPAKVSRKNNLVEVELFKVVTSIQKDDLIATLSPNSFKPKTTKKINARAFKIDQSASFDIVLNVATDGKITVAPIYALTLSNYLAVDRLYVHDFYLI